MNGEKKYTVELSPEAKEDLASYEKDSPQATVIRIQRMIKDLAVNPRKWGIGDPERLKHFKNQEIWSRHVNKKHRMVYEIDEKLKKVLVHSLLKHYGDK